MNITRILSSALSRLKLSTKAINRKSNKEVRYSIVKRMIEEEARKAGKQKRKKGDTGQEKAIKNVRKTGIKFSDRLARAIFRAATLAKEKPNYAPKLNLDAMPDLSRIPIFTFKKARGYFFYGYELYMNCEDEDTERIPKGVSKFNKDSTRYSGTRFYGIWTNKLISKRKANLLIENRLGYNVNLGFLENANIETSDPASDEFRDCFIVGYKYISLARAE